MKIVFIFKSGRKQRITHKKEFPSEFFYGFIQLKSKGVNVSILDEDDLNVNGTPGLLWKILTALLIRLTNVHVWAVKQLVKRDTLLRLNGFDKIVVTTNTFGICLCLLRRLNLIKPQLFIIAMGLLPFEPTKAKLILIKWILGKNCIITISKSEYAHLNKTFNEGLNLKYIPFGVDTKYWYPTNSSHSEDDYVLSIGNDDYRDYQTLIDSWESSFPTLIIITNHKINTNKENINIINGDWRKQIISDDQMRIYIQHALFLVIPLKPTIQPSGQSVCLQAMACGKAVIISDIEGIWDRELMKNRDTCLLVDSGSIVEMKSAVMFLLEDKSTRERIGIASRKVIEEHLNITVTSESLENCLVTGCDS